jgi:hypothetical protein
MNMKKSLSLIMLLMFGTLSSQAEDLGMWSLDYMTVYDLAERIAEDFKQEFQIRDVGIQSVISVEAEIEPFQDLVCLMNAIQTRYSWELRSSGLSAEEVELAVTIAGINIKMYAKGVMEATAKLAADYGV